MKESTVLGCYFNLCKKCREFFEETNMNILATKYVGNIGEKEK